MTQIDEPAAEAAGRPRLAELADQIRDGWIRGRGPLTGLSPLVAARGEAEALGASEDYMQRLDQIIDAARTLSGKRRTMAYGDAPQVLDREIGRLREIAQEA